MARPLIASHLLACGFRICRVQTRSVAPELCARLTSNRSRPRWRPRWFENNCFPAYEHVGRRVSDSFSAVWSGCFALVVVGHGLNGFRGDEGGILRWLGMLGIGSNMFDEVWWIFFSFFDEIEIEILLIAEGKYRTSRVLSFFVRLKLYQTVLLTLWIVDRCVRHGIVNLIYFEIIGTGKLNSALKDIEILLIEKDDLF